MNGVTGRMGTNQHLMRSIAEIIKQGGVKTSQETISYLIRSWSAGMKANWRSCAHALASASIQPNLTPSWLMISIQFISMLKSPTKE